MADGRVEPGFTPLVGRDDELNTMLAALDRAMLADGRIVLVSGEPGIGKTRLVEELVASARHSGALPAWGRSENADGAPPYWPWVQLLGALLDGSDPTVAAEALGDSAGTIATLLPRVKEMVTEVTPPPMLPPAEARFALHRAIVDCLGRLSRHRPLVLALDDLHWADAASLDLTRFVGSRLAGSAVLLVLTYRDIDAGASAAFEEVLGALARQSGLERVPLMGLTEPEVGRFMAQTVGLRSRPGLVTSVHGRTEGNPFFVAELTRLLHSEGLIGTPRLPAGDAVPAGVRDVIRRRLARLPEVATELLVLGAVIGREFELSLLGTVAGLGATDVVDRIAPAVTAGLIEEDASSAARFRFSHALVRDTIYWGLSELRRASLHGRVAACLQARQGTGVGVATLADHYFRSAPVVGPDPGIEYCVAAAEEAEAALAFERAEEQLRRALSLVERLPAGAARSQRELQVQNRLARLLVTLGHWGEPKVGQAYARAQELCRDIGETDELFAILFGLAGYHTFRCEDRIVAELSLQFLAVGEPTQSPQWLTAGHMCAGIARLHLGELAAATASFDTAAGYARTLPLTSEVAGRYLLHPLVNCLTWGGVCAQLRGREEQARALYEEAVELTTSVGHPLTTCVAVYFNSWSRVLADDPPEAGRWADRGLAICQEHGLPTFRRSFDIIRGWAIARQGQPEEGLRAVLAGVGAYRQTEERVGRVLFLTLLADIERRLGRVEQALNALDEAQEVVERFEQRIQEAELYRIRGELLAERGPGHVGEAVGWLERAISVAEVQGSVVFRQRAEAALALLQPANGSSPASPVSTLSPRESELLGLVGRGLTDKEIAGELVISLATVRSHLDRIRDKTGRRRRPELTRLAVDLGLTCD